MNNILENLNKKGSYYKFIGLVECYKIKELTPNIITSIKNLKQDFSKIAGFTISELSIATLDLLGIEKYHGDNENILYLLDNSDKIYWKRKMKNDI